MKKRNYISFFILLFITIVAISTLIILIGRDKKAQEKAAEEALQQLLTPPPVTIAPTPTLAPTPTEAPTVITELYPAYRLEDDEMKFGYIDITGNYIISPAFDTATAFHDGVAVVTLDGKNLVIDTEGKIIYSNSTTLSEFCNGTAIFSDSSTDSILYGFIDTSGQAIIEPKYKYVENFRSDNTAYVITSDDTYALIDKTGNILESYVKTKDIGANEIFQDGYLIYTETIKGKNNQSYNGYGVKNIRGEVLIKPEYSNIRYLGEGCFAATKPGLEYHETFYSKEALINYTGAQLTEYSFYDLSYIYNGVISATDETSTFFIDIEGNRMTNQPEFEGIGTLKSYGDVIEAYVDGQRFYCTNNKIIFWQEDQTYDLSESLTVSTRKYRPNRFALVNYPYIEGIENPEIKDAINVALESIFTDPRKEIAVEPITEIRDVYSAKLLGNLLIVERSGYDYTFGAAHGNPFDFYYYIDIRTGVFYKFKDLFIEGKDYAIKINDMISSEVKKDLTSEQPRFFDGDAGFKGISEEPLFILDKDAVTIYFTPYEIAPYASGFPEFLIPFADIASFINKNGDFWNSFN